jgi:subtilase family serine protease
MYDSGTSMATPITAGACALLRQYFIEQLGVTPSATLLKAAIIIDNLLLQSHQVLN